VDSAALDGRPGHAHSHGLLEAEVGVGDDQLHALKPVRLERAQERRPEGPVLAVAHREAQDLAAAVAAHPGGHDYGLGDDAAVDSGLAVGGVHEHIGEDLAGQRPVPER
jgi:hypothetical protein